jgi:hypothetical protein
MLLLVSWCSLNPSLLPFLPLSHTPHPPSVISNTQPSPSSPRRRRLAVAVAAAASPSSPRRRRRCRPPRCRRFSIAPLLLRISLGATSLPCLLLPPSCHSPRCCLAAVAAPSLLRWKAAASNDHGRGGGGRSQGCPRSVERSGCRRGDGRSEGVRATQDRRGNGRSEL